MYESISEIRDCYPVNVGFFVNNPECFQEQSQVHSINTWIKHAINMKGWKLGYEGPISNLSCSQKRCTLLALQIFKFTT